jgi:polyisoprenoid-binding protein YceI
MKKIFLPIAIAATMLLSAFTVYTSTSWKIADGYSIKFTSDDPSGAFTSLKGDISFDANDLANSKFNVTVDVSSINTGNGMKNSKAKGKQYFDVDTYPTIKYTSSKITKTATGYQAEGTLDMHGVQKPLTIPFTFANNTFSGSFSVNRIDYGVGTAGHAESVLKVDVSVPVTK